MHTRLLLVWAILGLAALTVTALFGAPAGRAAPNLSTGPDPFRPLPEDVSHDGLVQGERVPVGALLDAVRLELAPLRDDAALRAEYAALAEAHRLPDGDAAWAEYLAVRTAFEATRSGGWWHVAWAITDKEPTSRHIWDAWSGWPGGPAAGLSAVAECDEISALFSVTARALGADRVGLFWPTTNHTVAVWTPPQSRARVVVPTTPIFLSPGETIGTTEMDPHAQRTIYTYSSTDGAFQATLPGELARFFHIQARRYAGASAETNQALRDLRERAYGQGWTLAQVHRAADDIAQRARRPADRRAVDAFRVEYARD